MGNVHRRIGGFTDLYRPGQKKVESLPGKLFFLFENQINAQAKNNAAGYYLKLAATLSQINRLPISN